MYKRQYNGYDEEDFAPYRHITPDEDKFIITHVGQIFKNRNYDVFWKAIKELVLSNDEIRSKLHVRFIGQIDESVHTSVEKYGLENYFEHIPAVQHKEVPKYLFQSHLLYLPLDNVKGAEKKIPGKVFEYIASNRPVLAIVAEVGDLNHLLLTNTSNLVFSCDDEIEKLILFVKDVLHKNRKEMRNDEILNFSRGVQIESFSRILGIN